MINIYEYIDGDRIKVKNLSFGDIIAGQTKIEKKICISPDSDVYRLELELVYPKGIIVEVDGNNVKMEEKVPVKAENGENRIIGGAFSEDINLSVSSEKDISDVFPSITFKWSYLRTITEIG